MVLADNIHVGSKKECVIMGLAASQARLLTITSRLSSVEMRQQRIAMDKMRLASDTDKVSEKYTNAINNKTLSISNGSEEVPMTYSALASHGYSVMRASDGVIASSASSNNATTAPARANVSANVENDPEVQKWVGKPAPTPPTFTETVPIAPKEKIAKPTAPTNSNTTITVPDFDKTISYAQQLASTSYNYTHSWDGFNSEKQQSLFAKQVLDSSLQGLVNNLFYQNLSNTGRNLEETRSKAQQTYDRAPKNLDTGRTGDYGQSSFGGFGKVKTAENEYGTTILSALKTAQSSANSEAENIKQNNITAQNNYDAELEKYNQNQQEWNTYNTKKAEYDQKYQAYQAQLNQYNIDYANWVTANSSSNSSEGASKAGQTTGASSGSTGSTGAAGTTGVSAAASQELAEQLKNTQFLIQGLLSGYLALVKDGQQVSLSSATDIIESYDKSDDAAAEAEYNAETNKINRKEKMLDMQAKRLDTEYSALTNEYNSVKTIIDNHAQKDFEYLS